jgi:hypothetical protein
VTLAISSAPAAVQAVSKTTLSLRRYRKSVTALTAAEVASLRSGITKMLELSDDRGFEYWAGIHGLPLPISCTHGSPLFLPWHRAYLYYFEQHLLDVMPAGAQVSLPWWDWSTQAGIPAAYAAEKLPGGAANPLAGARVSGIPAAQFNEFNVPPAERRPFDFRPEHQLTPVSKRVMITEKLRALVSPGQEFSVRIVPYVRPEHAASLPANLVTDLLQLHRVDLLTYQ